MDLTWHSFLLGMLCGVILTVCVTYPVYVERAELRDSLRDSLNSIEFRLDDGDIEIKWDI